ncbi:ribulose-phosphate 3-epimerase [Streptomyces sp. RP5T]|nr:ribulose-phosphate 3-epimerase [Streptomyces sp. RP5T]
MDQVASVADGFHIDVFDGHNVDELLFGPDFVSAVRARTGLVLDVHLNVMDPDRWARRFIDVGADMITVQSGACPDVHRTLGSIREAGVQASLGVETHEAVANAAALAAEVDRFLLMGTAIGIKGVSQDPATPQRVSDLRRHAKAVQQDRPIFVDGGIRAETIEFLAAAGTDGVIPGSLVYGAPDPAAAIRYLHSLR